MKKAFILLLGLLMTTAAVAQAPKSYRFSLEDCLRFAFANSNERKSMELSGESLQTTYEQSKKQWVPNLSASVSENFSNNANGWSIIIYYDNSVPRVTPRDFFCPESRDDITRYV